MSHSLRLTRARNARVLAGDIGATNSRFAIYGVRSDGVELLRQETYPSSAHDCLTEVLAKFLADEGEDVEAACLGVPAPIQSGSSFSLINLPWRVDPQELVRTIGTSQVALINDVEAAAAGIPGLSADHVHCLQPGVQDLRGNRVVMSVGTGLGVSTLTPTGDTFATEAGHATFSPREDEDFDIFAVLKSAHGHVSWERVTSGAAIARIHSVLSANGSAALDGPEIVKRSETDAGCRRTVDTIRRYIGTAAGNIALTLMSTGGLYLRGGIATKILDAKNAQPFLDAFHDKGRMRSLLERIPVYVVDEHEMALRGAAHTAMAFFED